MDPTAMEKAQKQRDLADCVLSESWVYTAVGCAVAIPLGIRAKSLSPLVYCGLAGTLGDLLNGYYQCEKQRASLKDLEPKIPDLGNLPGFK